MNLTLLPPIPADRDWRDEAACLSTDPDAMQPESATPAELELAMSVCLGCPVLAQCEQLAEDQAGAYGIHAGKWYGEPPRNPDLSCQWCEAPLTQAPTGQVPKYCSASCRKLAFRARTVSA